MNKQKISIVLDIGFELNKAFEKRFEEAKQNKDKHAMMAYADMHNDMVKIITDIVRIENK